MRPKAFAVVIFSLFFLMLSAACVTAPVEQGGGAAAVDRSFEIRMKQGQDFLSRKDYGRAAAEFQAAVALKPDSARAHNDLGLCYFHQRDYDPAVEQFEKAVALDPSYATAFNNLAGSYSMRLQFPPAEEAYKKALSLSPDMISANYSLGILLTNLARKDEGAVYLARGIALDPDFLESHREMITQYSSLFFDMKEAYFVYAGAYALAGNVEKAVGYLVRAKEAGFTDWQRILRDKEFEKVRDDPRIKKFLSDL
jgi:tetratricopeptide (TPR) repeat protein